MDRPADFVWSGQIGDPESDPVLMETIAMFVSLLLLIALAVRLKYIRKNRFRKTAVPVVSLIFMFFVRHWISNIASDIPAGNTVPLSIIPAILIFRPSILKDA
jgi:hypothetical protein